jgi:hypothetical protein
MLLLSLHCTGVQGKEPRRLYIWSFSMLVPFQEHRLHTPFGWHVRRSKMPSVIIASIAELLLLLVRHTFLLPIGLPGGDRLGDICGIHRQNRWTLDICFASYVVVAVPLHDICCVAHWLSSSGWTSANFGSDMLRAVTVD